MGFQKLTIDRWALSSNDASAFYAASDPKIQVWNPSMYDPIQKLAAQQYHVPLADISNQQLNQIFWQESIKNYVRYPKYHLERIAPHIGKLPVFHPRWRHMGHVNGK